MSAARGYRLDPDDLLFFRDGKPSTQGSDHYLASVFPPAPSTLFGAVRTRRLVDKGVALEGLTKTNWAERLGAALEQELGPWGGLGEMRLRGPWLVRGENEILLPAPADLGVRTGRFTEVESAFRFRLEEAEAGSWSHPLLPWRPYSRVGEEWTPVEPESVVSAAGTWWLTAAGLTAWAAGGVPETAHFVHRDDLWQPEPRTGVGLEEQTRQAREHYLYTFGFVRLRKGIAIGFDAQGGLLDGEGGMRLGGEGRTVTLLPGPQFPGQPELGGTGGRTVVVCLTPMLSASGAYPPGFSGDRLDSNFGQSSCKLIGAMVRGPQPAGGWDIAQRRAKPLRRAIAPGAVFVFDELPAAAVAALWGTTLSDFAEEGANQQGFGLIASGSYPT
jgi:CRISPR-associated protein Cmr3